MNIEELAKQIHQMREDLEEIERIMIRIEDGGKMIQIKIEKKEKIDLEKLANQIKEQKKISQSDPEEKKEPYKKPGKKGRGSEQKKLDTGKIIALRKAGWQIDKIAEEMRCSTSSIYRVIKQEEDKEKELDALAESILN